MWNRSFGVQWWSLILFSKCLLGQVVHGGCIFSECTQRLSSVLILFSFISLLFRYYSYIYSLVTYLCLTMANKIEKPFSLKLHNWGRVDVLNIFGVWFLIVAMFFKIHIFCQYDFKKVLQYAPCHKDYILIYPWIEYWCMGEGSKNWSVPPFQIHVIEPNWYLCFKIYLDSYYKSILNVCKQGF